MPQPRNQPAGQPPASAPGAAAGAATVASPFLAASVAPALAAAGTAALTGAALTQAVRGLVAGFDSLAENRFREDGIFTLSELRTAYPQRRVSELEKLITQELRFEREFRRKMRARLERDLPEALGKPDPEARRAALQGIFDREKRYTVARSEAMFMRALGKAEVLTLKEVSPEGAYWKLSPHVQQHTLDCLAVGEKFWPWDVIDDFQPPVHHGCACSLHSLDDAVAAGWMARDQIPDTDDAILRARQALADAEEMEESLEEAEIRAYIESEVLEEAPNVLAMHRRRHPLRWDKGAEKGGQFRPSRGGSPGRSLRSLFPHPKSPMQMRADRRGRWTWVNGRHIRVPEADSWTRKVAGHSYVSPAGSTNIYKDGKLVDGVGMTSLERRPRRATAKPETPEKIARHAATIRDDLRAAAAAEATKSSVRAPLKEGDGPSALLALRQSGFRIVRAVPSSPGTKLTFANHVTDAQLEAIFDGAAIRDVNWIPVPPPSSAGHELRRAPHTFEEFREDAFAWAHELADRHGAKAHLSDIRIDPDLSDHAGWRSWTGEADLGREVEIDIRLAGTARKHDEALSEDEKRGVWSSYWVAAHEVGHAVNPIEPIFYEGANANLEEALDEEAAHVLAVERLTEQNQTDVLRWRKENPDAIAVRGVYRQQRAQLGRLLDEAGIVDTFDRRQIIMELKFRVDPVERIHTIAELIQAHAGGDLDDLLSHVENAMETQSKDMGAALPPFDQSPGHRQVGNIGYGRFEDAKLSADGTELRLKDGGLRRIETLPIPKDIPELHAMTDGTALVVYKPKQHPTSGLRNGDGTPKNFRYVDSRDRAKMILRAFTGKGSPGTFGLKEIHAAGDTPESLAAKLEGEKDWTTIKTVPVKRRFDGSYGVGFVGHDGRRLSALGDAKAAAETALIRAGQGGMASPGTEDDEGWIGSKWFKKVTHSGQGQIHPAEQLMIDMAVGADEAKKKKVTPPDPLVGVKIGGDPDAGPAKGAIPSYDATALELGKVAGGSNGARWAYDKDGKRYLVKTYKGNRDRVAGELLANAIYRHMGAATPVAGTITTPGDTPDFRQIPDVKIDEPDLPEVKAGRRISTGVIVCEPDGRLWIFEPKGHFGGYKHTFPKGGLEHGLTAQQNAHKELWEETGLHAHITGFLGDYEGDTSTSRYYMAVRTGGEPATGNDSETEAVKLVTPADAMEMLNRDRDKKILADALLKGLPKEQHEDFMPPPRAGLALTYPTLEGKIRRDFKPSKEVGQHYMVDALLGNYDFIGLENDNILWDEDGQPIRLDQGAAFEYRARGERKPFGPVPTEVWTMLSKGQGARGVIVDEDGMRVQAKAIGQKMTPTRIDKLVDEAPFDDNDMRERVRDSLKARVAWMKAFGAGKIDLPKPGEGDDAHEILFQSQGKVKLFPEEEEAIYAFSEGMAGEINAALKSDGEWSKPVKKAIKGLDSVMSVAKVKEDVIAYAPINLDGKPGDGLEGKTLQEKGFLSLFIDRPAGDSIVRVTVPEGSRAVYAGLFDDLPEDAPDLIVARNARMRVTKIVDEDGQRVIYVTLSAKPPAPKSSSKSSKWKPVGPLPAPSWLVKEAEAAKGDLSGFLLSELHKLAVTKTLKAEDRKAAQDEIKKRAGTKIVEALLLEEAKGNTGCMVALYPSPADQRRLSVPGGEPTEEIHLTLAFMGDAKDIDGETLKKVVEGFAVGCPSIDGEISGIGTFTAGPKPVTYASADLPDLPAQRERLVEALKLAGLPVSEAHGFTPHLTLAYDDREVIVKPRPIRFKAITIKLGDERIDIPLAG